MSRKTKKEKILAEYHRKLEQLQSAVPKPVIKYEIPSVVTTPRPTAPKVVSDYSYVLSDLRRILFLTALAICAQVVLWYYLQK